MTETRQTDTRQLSIAALHAEMRASRLGSVQLVEDAASQAARHAGLNAMAWTDWEGALAEARACDRDLAAGRWRGPLHGIPISIKDLYRVRGTGMEAGTRAPLPDLGVDEALAVRRLRAAGAIVFGKTNMHEIALGSTGENEWTGDVRNPYDPARQAGGSSSGAGVAVAVGIGVAAVGSDTGGSVRIPANFCGVVGLKPSFGAIPLEGALHLSWSCDHAGPLSRCVGDARRMFEAMSGRSTSHGATPRAPRLAVPREWLAARMAPEVGAAFERLLAELAARGARVESVPISHMDLAWKYYTPIVRAEAAYVHREALARGGEGFSSGVLELLRLGEQVSSGEYFEAMRCRGVLLAELRAILREFDAIAMPTAAVLPPLRGQTEVAVAGGAKLSVRETVLGQTLPFNYAALPAITLPFASIDGLPAGLQLVGDHDADARLLALAGWCESRIRLGGWFEPGNF